MKFVAFLVVYVLVSIKAYRNTRDWHIENSINPNTFDVVTVLIPIVNIMPMIIYAPTKPMERMTFAKYFFRIGGDSE